jgi:hypothetical protein
MDKLPAMKAVTISELRSESSENLARAKWAGMMAATLFDYFPPPEVGSAETLLSGAVKMFLMYPREAVEAVCNPVSGLPSQVKWAPRLAEIRQALEIATGPLQRRQERERQIAEQLEARKQITDQRPRPTYEELQRRCAEVGLHIGPKGSRLGPLDPGKVMEKHGISKEQWAAIPAKGSKFSPGQGKWVKPGDAA